MALKHNRAGVLRIIRELEPWIRGFASAQGWPGFFRVEPAGGICGGLNIGPGCETMKVHWKVRQFTPNDQPCERSLFDFYRYPDDVEGVLSPLFIGEFGDRCTDLELPYSSTLEPSPDETKVTIAVGRRFEVPWSRLSIAWRQGTKQTDQEARVSASLRPDFFRKYHRRGTDGWSRVMDSLAELGAMPSVSVVPGGDQPEPIADDYSNFIFGEPEWRTDLTGFLEEIRTNPSWEHVHRADGFVVFYRNDLLPDFLLEP
jgi:hypothetical protein